MATKKDLVEAHSFSRRRLVTAFVSGAPGGREVEPARPGRAIVGGIALAILLVAGAAVAGVFTSNVEVDYDQPGILLDEDTGNLFVILPEPEETGIAAPEDGGPDVRPIVNSTSARLILGPEVTPQTVPGDEIADVRKGATIGIPGAPATVPAPDALLQSGWTACTASDAGIRLDVAPEPGVTPAPTAAFTVTTGKADYLVAEAESADGEAPLRAYAYPIPKNASDGLTAAVGADDVGSAIEVPRQWVDLLPPGGELGSVGLGLEDVGRPAPGEGVPADARIGDTFDPGTGGTGLFTQAGPVLVSDPFPAAVVQYLVEADELARGFRSKEREIDTAAVNYEDAPYEQASWPTDLPTDPSGPTDSACAVLQPSTDGPPAVVLGTDPTDGAVPDEVEPGDTLPTVEAGGGSVVLSGSFDGAVDSAAVLVDDRGFAFPLVGTAVDDLGYGGVDLPGVPESWLGLFAEGVPLSRDAALCPPSLSKRPTCG